MGWLACVSAIDEGAGLQLVIQQNGVRILGAQTMPTLTEHRIYRRGGWEGRVSKYFRFESALSSEVALLYPTCERCITRGAKSINYLVILYILDTINL